MNYPLPALPRIRRSRASALLLAALSSLLFLTMYDDAFAPPEGFNYDESKVPQFELPDPLKMEDGTPVTSAEQWPARRAELLALFETHVYGKTPEAARQRKAVFETRKTVEGFLDGKATLKEVRGWFSGTPGSGPYMDILLITPASAGCSDPAPAFIGYNFGGNHAIHPSPEITITESWMRSSKEKGLVENNRATEASRGYKASRWPVEMIVDRGYALATIYYGDVDPDFDDDFKNGVHPLFLKDGQAKPAPDEWGSIGAWAWGLSRALDYLEQDPAVDGEKVAVLGHSRLGKTSLWAGATDERFAIVISNDSGCGGAALSRRAFGETVERINNSFPHWFCDNFTKYNSNENALPVDQHQLIALMAPRPVYIASATEDEWADPRGEFLSGLHANPVYALFNKTGLDVTDHPAPDTPVGTHIGYHLRTGPHDLAPYDWQQYLNFADRHYGRK